MTDIERQIYALSPNEYLKGYELLKEINDVQLKSRMHTYVDHMKLLAYSFFG